MTFLDELMRIKNKLIEELSSGEWKKERNERYKHCQKILSKQNIEHLSEEDFSELIKSLWASNMWTNKDHLVKKIINKNGMDLIRSSLKDLLYGTDAISKRFDVFSSKIKHLGPSSVTEILVFFKPHKYCLWNDKPKEVIPRLRLDTKLPDRVYKYQIKGKDYELISILMNKFLDDMKANGFPKADFLDLDIVMWLLFLEYTEEEVEEEKIGVPPITRRSNFKNHHSHMKMLKVFYWN